MASGEEAETHYGTDPYAARSCVCLLHPSAGATKAKLRNTPLVQEYAVKFDTIRLCSFKRKFAGYGLFG
jgi:hypothetical protein